MVALKAAVVAVGVTVPLWGTIWLAPHFGAVTAVFAVVAGLATAWATSE